MVAVRVLEDVNDELPDAVVLDVVEAVPLGVIEKDKNDGDVVAVIVHETDRVGVTVGADGEREGDDVPVTVSVTVGVTVCVTVCVAENVSESELANTATGSARMHSATSKHDQANE